MVTASDETAFLDEAKDVIEHRFEEYGETFVDTGGLKELMHYGKLHRSGRYPWGSGKDPYQSSGDFLSRVESIQKELGVKDDKATANAMGIGLADFRTQISAAKHDRRDTLREKAASMENDGRSRGEIARSLGLPNESSVRALLNEGTASRKNKGKATADILVKAIEEKGAIDVGKGVAETLGVSKGVLDEAVLRAQAKTGYDLDGISIPNSAKGTRTTVSFLHPAGESLQKYYQDPAQIHSIVDYHSDDGGDTYRKVQYPESLSSSRVAVRYGDQGGSGMDGVIEIRPGVKDLSLGDARYAQVRILVDGTHYLKGMAMYSNSLPDGVDVRFNTNKKTGTPMLGKGKNTVLKEIKHDDPDNPFGATLTAEGQSTWVDVSGKERLSPINKLRQEGDWEKYSKTLSSQFLSKQPSDFVKRQLEETRKNYRQQFDEIQSLTNPVVKRKLLDDFAQSCDTAAWNLKAAALPGQTSQVLLPLPNIKPDQCYAPNYPNGTKLVLVRFPHAGTFELPLVTVNNNDKDGRETIGPTVKDAIGISPKTANQLSGADFDGDTVVAIPLSSTTRIKVSDPIKGLADFDPKAAYGPPDNGEITYRLMTKKDKQKKMGEVSNLITDMTLKGAPADELERAVKHSMVVIDAEKHKLDYMRSYKDQGIAELKHKWQEHYDPTLGRVTKGASTLISKHKHELAVPETQGSPRIDPETGKLIYKSSGRKYVPKKGPNKGQLVEATAKRKTILEVDDVHVMSSGTEIEDLYADHANAMKALANEARKAELATPKLKYNPAAAANYSDAVASLNTKLMAVRKNAPRQRQAVALANSILKSKVAAITEDGGTVDSDAMKKMRRIAVNNARAKLGIPKKANEIDITDREWEAIQHGALHDSRVAEILIHADGEKLRQRSLPQNETKLSDNQVAKLQALISSRKDTMTNAMIADALGCSVSTVQRYASELKEAA